VIEVGAYADILLVDGNPLEDATLLADYEENIDLIMKDGKIYKNTL
jgi:imidazolonepropionase-like amidohydrolase